MKQSVTALVFLLLPMLALADSGRILYVSGGVTVERQGTLYRAVPRAKVIEGDVINTGDAGRVHIRMSDRTLLSLKPGTEFVLEQYRYREPEARPTSARRETVAETEGQNRSFFRLVRGGLRAVTGLIGQQDRNAFGVETPVATIGIRGTSFTADLEPLEDSDAVAQQTLLQLASAAGLLLSDAGSLLAQATGGPPRSKLTVGVGEGSIILTNSQGSLILENGEYAEVLPGDEPRRRIRPATDSAAQRGDDVEETQFDSDEADSGTQGLGTRRQDTRRNNSDPNSSDSPETKGEVPDLVTEETELPDFQGPRRNLAVATQQLAGEPDFSAPGDAQVTSTAAEATRTDEQANVIAFIGGFERDGDTVPAVFDIGDGNVANAGAAPELGLRWGRWSGGQGVLRFADGSEQPFDLSSAQLHLIQSANRAGRVALPSTGTRDFRLVGNTDPTDNAGNVGFLGQASLSANFTSREVTSTLDLSIANQVWSANGSARLGANGGPANAFGGNYADVRAGGQLGQGRFAGFITDQAAGAGLSYRLQSGDRTVNGVAAFAGPQ